MHLNHPLCMACVNLVLHLCMWGDYPENCGECIYCFCRTESLLVCDSQHYQSSWSAARFCHRAPSKWIVKPWEPELRQQGQGAHWVPIPWWDFIGECRDFVPPPNLLVWERKNKQTKTHWRTAQSDCCYLTSRGELMTKKLWKKQLQSGVLATVICSQH